MANNELKTTKEIIELFRDTVMTLLKYGEDEADRILNEMRNKKLILMYGAVLGDGQTMPEPYIIKDPDLVEFIKKELDNVNKGITMGDEGYFPAVLMKNAAGYPTYMINPKDRDRFESILMKYYVKTNEIISEIPTNDFEEYAKGEQATVLKGLTEDQYLYIAEKTKNNPESYSFSAQRDIDGTYCVTVLSRNMLTNKNADASFFAGLTVAKALDKDSEIYKNLRYNKDLLNEIMSYNDESHPMYISQARNAGQFMKVSIDPETNQRICQVFNGDTSSPIATIKTSRDALADPAYLQDVLRYYNHMVEPVRIYDMTVQELDKLKTETADPDKITELTNMKKYINSLNEQHVKLETAIRQHALTGDDRDFAAGNLLRPMVSGKETYKEEVFKTYGKFVEKEAIKRTVIDLNEANKIQLQNVAAKYGIKGKEFENLVYKFNNGLMYNKNYLSTIQAGEPLTPERIEEQLKCYKTEFAKNIIKEINPEDRKTAYIGIIQSMDAVENIQPLKLVEQKQIDTNLIKVNIDAPAMIMTKTPEGFDELISRVRVEELAGVALSKEELAVEQKIAFNGYLAEAQIATKEAINTPALKVNISHNNAIEEAITKDYNKEQTDLYYQLNHGIVKVGDTIVIGQSEAAQTLVRSQIEAMHGIPSLRTEMRQHEEELAKLSDGSIVPEDGSNLGNAAMDPSKMTNDDRANLEEDYSPELGLD